MGIRDTTICRVSCVRPAGHISVGSFVMPFLPERKTICRNRRYRASSTVTSCLRLNVTAGKISIHMKSVMNTGTKAPRILEAFWNWLEKQHPPKGSRLEKAVNYARNQKPYAETYLQDGRCSLSNNPSENSIRPFTVGRKNWLYCDTPGGAHASATVYTMVEMAKAHGVNVEKYLTFLLEKRPHAGMTDEDLEKLAPWSEEARICCGFAQQIAFT